MLEDDRNTYSCKELNYLTQPEKIVNSSQKRCDEEVKYIVI